MRSCILNPRWVSAAHPFGESVVQRGQIAQLAASRPPMLNPLAGQATIGYGRDATAP